MFSEEYTKVWYLVSSLPKALTSLPYLLAISQLIPQAKPNKVWTSCTSSLDLERVDQNSFPELKLRGLIKATHSHLDTHASHDHTDIHTDFLPNSQVPNLLLGSFCVVRSLGRSSRMNIWETWLYSLPILLNKNNSHWFLRVEMIHFSPYMNPWSCKQPGIGAGEVVPESLVVILTLETSDLVPWHPRNAEIWSSGGPADVLWPPQSLYHRGGVLTPKLTAKSL